MINIELTKEEISNILVLIAKAPITGNEALVVAQLQLKLSNSQSKSDAPVEPKTTPKGNVIEGVK